MRTASDAMPKEALPLHVPGLDSSRHARRHLAQSLFGGTLLIGAWPVSWRRPSSTLRGRSPSVSHGDDLPLMFVNAH